jgi:geranylgeranyl diphosphate synthase type II
LLRFLLLVALFFEGIKHKVDEMSESKRVEIKGAGEMSDFLKVLKQKAAECEGELYKYFDGLKDKNTCLYDAMGYSVRLGGKRLRMLILIEAARLFWNGGKGGAVVKSNTTICGADGKGNTIGAGNIVGGAGVKGGIISSAGGGAACGKGTTDKSGTTDTGGIEATGVFAFAAAAEMIHTYSLIHDDLPAIDNAALRRGAPSNHKKYGECAAILAGDGLFHYAFEIMTKEALSHKVDCYKFVCAIDEIIAGAGVFGMIYGQALDTEVKNPPLELLKLIYQKKTAAMFVGAARAGAILGGANDKQADDMGDFAFNIGMAFQIKDDILDESGTARTTGKDAGNDKQNGKSTISTFGGIENAYKIACEYTEKAKKIILPYATDNFFVALCDFITERNL